MAVRLVTGGSAAASESSSWSNLLRYFVLQLVVLITFVTGSDIQFLFKLRSVHSNYYPR